MAQSEEAWTQLATKLPKELHHRLKVHCIQQDVSIMAFVISALKERLAQRGNGRRKLT